VTSGAAQPSARGTAILLAVLAALAAWLWLFERARLVAPAAPETEPPLLAASPDDVARLALVERGTALVASRAEDGWVDDAGRRWPGDAVDDVLQAIASLRPLMTVDPDPRLADDYGLGPAATRLELADGAGRRLVALDVGERNPAGTALYVRRGDDRTVVLVGAVLAWELDKLRGAAPHADPARNLTTRPKTHETLAGAGAPDSSRRTR
jgi:hypothetical protein